MGTGVALFIYETNFGLARLELKWLWMLRRSLPEMVQRVSKTEPILSSPEPALSQGERRHVGTVRKRKFGVPRFVAGNMSERRGFRGPGYLVSGADWIPGTASTPVSLSHQSDEA